MRKPRRHDQYGLGECIAAGVILGLIIAWSWLVK
jgi:hypothetical protein